MLCIATVQGFAKVLAWKFFSHLHKRFFESTMVSWPELVWNNDLVVNNGALTPRGTRGEGWVGASAPILPHQKCQATLQGWYTFISVTEVFYLQFVWFTQTFRTIPPPACTTWQQPHDMCNICLWSNRWPEKQKEQQTVWLKWFGVRFIVYTKTRHLLFWFPGTMRVTHTAYRVAPKETAT